MWKNAKNPVPIGNLQLHVGVFVWIDRSWKEHPFFYNKFRINSNELLQQVKALGPDNIYWIPSKSTAEPTASSSTQESGEEQTAHEDAAALVRQKDAEVKRQRLLIAKAEQDWSKAAHLVRESLLGLRDAPRQSGSKMRELTKTAAHSVSSGKALLHMLADKGDRGPQHHALNCMTLAMLVAKSMGLPTDIVGEVALGALAHDAGSTMIPKHILRARKRSAAEEKLYREHPRLGIELAAISGAFSEVAMSAIRDHHEMLDGSGYPSGKKGAEIGIAARIVAAVNLYDRYCSPESPEAEAMQPVTALKTLWKDRQDELDPAILTALIRLLGIYPPGTIVSLNDGSLGLVVSPGKSSLFPKVLIYVPEIAKEDAPIIDLVEGGALAIEEALRPSDVPADALDWIKPRERLTYYFTAEQSE